MMRENIADRGIWTAKKRYILNVWDSEGVRYEEPKLKIMGIEAVKSSTPAPCRKMIKDGLKLVMSGTEDDVIKFIDKCRREFKTLTQKKYLSQDQFLMWISIRIRVRFIEREPLFNVGVPCCLTSLLNNIS